MKYAYLVSSGSSERNYGDDIQMYAVKQLYQYMGISEKELVPITTKDLFEYSGKEYLIVPINIPFWGKYSSLSEKIIPVYLGISVLNASVAKSLKWKEFEPIGCRDQRTLEIVRSCGVEAYLNGCMSLTLPKAKNRESASKVYIVEVCEELMEAIPKELKEGAVYKKQQFWGREVTEEEALLAYDEYQREAKLVITSRLHCAVPCVAFGIPVILAMKQESFRMGWLHKLIPIYKESEFDSIDWNPQPVDVENLKELIKENAIRRLREAWDEYNLRYSISEFYEDKLRDDIYVEGMYEPVEFIKANWNKEKGHKYVIWGATQTADDLYEYIQKNYKKAELVGVIDIYNEFEIYGTRTGKLEVLEKVDSDTTVFVTAEKASEMAQTLFHQKNIKNFVICWRNRNVCVNENISV